jgi:SPP1 family predicted phage head-tail adaptor
MALPKKLSTGVRYLGASAFNAYINFINPNAGQASDGTPNPPTSVASGIHANVSPWRAKELDKSQIRVGQSSYKIVIRYPKTYSIDTGMQIQLRNQLHNIESFYDPDGQQVELHIWTWVSSDTVNS